MGFFSWKCALCHTSISNKYSNRGAEPCVVICPDSTIVEENDYDGYGVFGGLDIYELVSAWHDGPGDREHGIDLQFEEVDVGTLPQLKWPIKILCKDCHDHRKGPRTRYHRLPSSPNCPDQGYFYDDNSDYY